MSLETIKEAVAKLVSESFKDTLDEALEHRMSIFEAKDEGEGKEVTEEEDKDKTPLKEEDEDDDNDEDEDDEDEDSDTLEEALKITAKAVGSKNRDAPEEFEVKDMRELTKIVKTGKYGWLMVTKRNGDEDEYIVEKGKLVLM